MRPDSETRLAAITSRQWHFGERSVAGVASPSVVLSETGQGAVIVERALRLIDGGSTDGGLEALSARFGVDAPRLRQLFTEHLGASPREIVLSLRLHFARQLVEETSLPMTRIAVQAGCRSVRQLQAAMRDHLGLAPGALRRGGVRPKRNDLVLRLRLRQPYDWAGILSFLAPRATPGVEAVVDGAYRRTIQDAKGEGIIEIRPAAEGDALLLAIDASPLSDLFRIGARASRLFDLGADPVGIDAHLSRDLDPARLVAARPGVRVPGTWDPFETAIRAILGQQVSVRAATTLAGRLVRAFGRPLRRASGHLTHHFPAPERLFSAAVESVGVPRARAEAVRNLARAAGEERLDLEPARGLELYVRSLRALPGIGPWTAHYLALRTGESDAFPAGDLVLRHHASRSAAWRPWRSYAAMHLWLAHAEGTN